MLYFLASAHANRKGDRMMPGGDKPKYTEKQKRQAEHIEEDYQERGVPEEEAERRAWATINAVTVGRGTGWGPTAASGGSGSPGLS